MTILIAITIVVCVTIVSLVAGAVVYRRNETRQYGPSTWDMLSSRRKDRHIAVANIDGGDPATRLEAFVTEGINPTVWCRIVIGEQGNGFMLKDLKAAVTAAEEDLKNHEYKKLEER